MKPLAAHVSAFLHEHLPRDKGASPHTVAAYTQALKLLVCFAAARTGRRPSQLALEQIDADLVLSFLEHIERGGASVRTRNLRLAAIKTFFRLVEWREPATLEQVRRIGLIPCKKTDTALVAWLTHAEIRALLNAPDTRRRDGVRDRAMLHMAYTCGLRVSELTGLRLEDYDSRNAEIRVIGKGRRERRLPLWKETRRDLDRWIRLRNPHGDRELFHNRDGRKMSRWGFGYILDKHAASAAQVERSMAEKRVTPHVLRHSCAMHTLQANETDLRKVSLWLGHASVQTTEVYLHADPTEKLGMLDAALRPDLKPGRFREPDKLLAMLGGDNRDASAGHSGKRRHDT